MLRVLRRKGVMKKVLWFVAIVIVVVFGLAGQSYLLSDKAQAVNYAGKVFGKKISFEEFIEQKRQVYIQAALQYGDNLAQVEDMLNFDAETWNRIILLHEANKRGIKVSDEELVETIQTAPLFQRDGKFDNWLYQQILNSNMIGMKPRHYEESLRDTLKIGRLLDQETEDVSVSLDEAREAFRWENEKVQVSYAFFPVASYTGEVGLDDAAVQQYYTENQADFVRPETIEVSYMRIDYPQPQDVTEVTADETPEAGAESADDTMSPAAETEPAPAAEAAADAEAAPEDPAVVPAIRDEDKAITAQKAREIYDDITTDNDIARAAAAHGLTITTTAPFSMEQPKLEDGWSFPLVQTLFAMETGTVSEPVETESGFQILKITARHPVVIPSFEEARDEVTEAWTKRKARMIARQKAQDTRPILIEKYGERRRPDFVDATAELGLDIQQTPAFHRGQYLPNIGLNKAFQDAAFGLNAKSPVSEVVETERGYAILHLDDRIPINEEEFAKARETVEARLLTEKQQKAMNEFMILLRLKANLEDNMPNLRGEGAGRET